MNTVFSNNKWYHVIGTFDGTTISFYVNGVLDNSITSAVSLDAVHTFNLGIGIDPVVDVDAFASQSIIDDVRIYNRALSASEVKQLYNTGAATIGHSNAIISNGLVGYWTFDGGSIDWNANTVRDMSGQGNTGTLISMSTTSSPTPAKSVRL